MSEFYDGENGANHRARAPNLYHTIAALSGPFPGTLQDLLDNRDREGLAKHLSEWDCGDRDDEPHTIDQLRGYDITEHDIEYAGEYTLVCHWGLGDAILMQRCDCCEREE